MKTAQEIQTIAIDAVRDVIKERGINQYQFDPHIGKAEFRACDYAGGYIDASNEWIGPFRKIPALHEIERAQASVQVRDEVGVMFLSVFIHQAGALICEVEVNVTTGFLQHW